MTDDLNKMLQKDMEKFQSYQGSGLDTSLPALVELAFTSLTALVALTWLITLFFLPGSVDGPTWMGLGALGMVIFGLPAALIYVLRRGGTRVIRDAVEGATR